MASEFPIDVLHAIASWIVSSGGPLAVANTINVHWYSANANPPVSVDSVLGDFTELTDPPCTGYGIRNVGSWTDMGRVGNGWQFQSDPLSFSNSGGTDWTPAIGVYLEDGAGNYLGALEFASVITLGPGDTLTLTLNPDDLNRY